LHSDLECHSRLFILALSDEAKASISFLCIVLPRATCQVYTSSLADSLLMPLTSQEWPRFGRHVSGAHSPRLALAKPFVKLRIGRSLE